MSDLVQHFAATAERADDKIVLSVLCSVDQGPAKQFRPVLNVDLDDAHALELLANLMMAIRPEGRAR